MSRFSEFYRQLKQRRVIRTAIVYVALVWGALQVADLLAEAAFLSESTVKWLILLALVGFPITLLLSWFFETPWRERKALSVLGDVTIILAVATGVLLLAWQQYFRSFARPAIAIAQIEATDTRADTPAFGDYVARRLRFALATRPELAVSGSDSSLSPGLSGMTVEEKARALSVDYLVTGTLNQGSGELLRLNLQLFDASGELLWSEGFEDRLLDFSQFESSILNAVWEHLPLPADSLVAARSTITDCEYPRDPGAVRMLVQAQGGLFDENSALAILSGLIEEFEDNGLAHLARARMYFAQLETGPSPRKPVLNNLARQDLDRFELKCPGHPAARLLRFHQNPGILVTPDDHHSFAMDYPNDARAQLAYAIALLGQGHNGEAIAMARSASRIDPLIPEIACNAMLILERAGSPEPAGNINKTGFSCPDPERVH